MKKQILAAFGLSVLLPASQAAATPFDSLIKMVVGEAAKELTDAKKQSACNSNDASVKKAKEEVDKVVSQSKALRSQLEKAAKDGKELRRKAEEAEKKSGAKSADALRAKKHLDDAVKSVNELAKKYNLQGVEVMKANLKFGLATAGKCK